MSLTFEEMGGPGHSAKDPRGPGTTLVTGACGFLGSEIVSLFRASGRRVIGTDLPGRTYPFPDDFRPADIRSRTELAPLFRGIHSVIHAAGLAHVFDKTGVRDDLFFEVNEVGTENAALAAAEAGVEHFILISSVAVYGETSSPADETFPCRPIGAYGESKERAEARAMRVAGEKGLSLTILRLATLYGEGDPGNMLRLIRTIDSGRFFWVGRGENRKSFLYRGDAARACLMALDQHSPGTYNVSAAPCRMRDLVHIIARSLGRRLRRGYVPTPIARLAVAALEAAGTAYHPSSRLSNTLRKWLQDDIYRAERFQQTFGFEPALSLEEGIRREVEWYRKGEKKIDC